MAEADGGKGSGFGAESHRRRRRLPSERYGPGSIRPLGFQDSPDEAHTTRSGEVISRIATAVSKPSNAHRRIAIRFCHFRLDPIISPNLFGFHIYRLDPEGEIIYPASEGAAETLYAIVLNQSVELQAEVAMVFLLQLIYRQRRQTEMQEAGLPIQQIDLEMARQDERALDDIRDVVNPLRMGWAHAAQLIVSQAEDAGIGLQVSYQPDPFPQRDELVHRLPYLRRLYNEIDVVRSSVDKVVGMGTGTGGRLAARGGQSEARDWLQQRTTATHVREYFNQAMRDAEVCGNGYATYSEDPPIGIYNLRPEDVVIERGRHFLIKDGELQALPKGIIHVRGVPQISSPYGISLLEVFMQTLVTHDVFENARRFAEELLAQRDRLPQEQESWAKATIAMADRAREAREKGIRSLLWFPLEHLPESDSQLYFPGLELL